MKNTSTTPFTPALTPGAAASNPSASYPSASMTNTKRCAKRTELLQKVPGLQCASELLQLQQQQNVKLQGQACTRDFTHLLPGPQKDEEQLIQALVLRTSSQINNPALRRFMAGVLRDADIFAAITVKPHLGQRYPIELMRSASRIALNSGFLPRDNGDLVHVAVILAGVREALIQHYPGMGFMSYELLLDFVRDDLRRLQAAQPEMAHMLRLAFDWGGDEEEQTDYVQWLKQAIGTAIQGAGMGCTTSMKRRT